MWLRRVVQPGRAAALLRGLGGGHRASSILPTVPPGFCAPLSHARALPIPNRSRPSAWRLTAWWRRIGMGRLPGGEGFPRPRRFALLAREGLLLAPLPPRGEETCFLPPGIHPLRSRCATLSLVSFLGQNSPASRGGRPLRHFVTDS